MCWRWSDWEASSWGFWATPWWSLDPSTGCTVWVADCSAALNRTLNPSVPWGSWVLRAVPILACCQSVVPSMSLLKENCGRTCTSQTACVVLENFAESKSLGPWLLLLPIPHVWPVGWPGTEKKSASQNVLLNKSRVLNSKYPKLSLGRSLDKKISASYAEYGKHT